MGKRAPAAPAPVVPPAPPITPTTGTGKEPDADEVTPTEELQKIEKEKTAVYAPVEAVDPVKPKGTVLDTEDAARKKERELAGKTGRRKTKKTGPQGLLTDANVYKKGLLT